MSAAQCDGGALITRIAQAQDRAAFAELFAHYAPRVKTLLVRSGSTPSAAEELAQEVMLAVWRKAHYFDPKRASAAAWIFTIARNLRIDSLRRGCIQKGQGLVERACAQGAGLEIFQHAAADRLAKLGPDAGLGTQGQVGGHNHGFRWAQGAGGVSQQALFTRQTTQAHDATPASRSIKARSFIMPKRIRALTVPRGTPSASEI